MGLLRRLIGGAFRRGSAHSKPPRVSATVDPVSADGTESTLLCDIERYCAAGAAWKAVEALDARLPAPASPTHAVALLGRLVAPVLDTCVSSGDAVAACDLEKLAYQRLIRHFEDPAHYDACFNVFDRNMHSLGVGLTVASTHETPEHRTAERLLFFLHNLGSDLAHLVLICDLVEAYLAQHPADAMNIGFIGAIEAAGAEPAPRLRLLRDRWGIKVWLASPKLRTQKLYAYAAEVLEEQSFDRLVFVGAPLGLSYASGLLGSERLAWLSMKFELSSFEHLFNRCSFVSGARRIRIVNGRKWREAPPLITERATLTPSGRSLPALEAARRFSTVFYTVNREEKIRNPRFLETVITILESQSDSCFVWTGREPSRDVVAAFASRGLSDRQFFAGWVAPDDLVLGGDIFLDTPVLSGTVAARAVACGRPVLTMTNAHSWINFFWPVYERDREARVSPDELDAAIDRLAKNGLLLECPDEQHYIAQAIKLAQDARLQSEFGAALKQFATRYFFNAVEAAEAHIANLRCAIERGAPDARR